MVTFFHRDCSGGSIELLLGDGLVDLCWYLPSGESSDTFSSPVAFLNLHGDARQHREQMKFLSQVSSMCFILIREDIQKIDSHMTECLKLFSSSPGGITLLKDVEKTPVDLKEVVPKLHTIKLVGKTTDKLRQAIRARIIKKMQNVTELRTIENHCTTTECKVLIDESGDACKQALCEANKLIRLISSCPTQSGIAVMLPLQGKDLWQAWAAKHKERYRQVHRGTNTVTKYTAIIDSESAEVRKQQLLCVKHLTSVMESFIASLLKFGGFSNKTVRNYFLWHLKRYLDDLSREEISKLQHCYRTAWSDFDSAQISEKNQYRTEMELLQNKIISASFGLEHLLRELGQVYEAASLPSECYGEGLSRLPRAVAELLIDGYPVELIDGDAAHVPERWISAILKEAVHMLEDPKVFVLSVLGLQSTGKSTMLNTVFGLQFNVSGGRCTRGAFMQLLPVDDELRRHTGCDYMLIIDTEGLRSPELDSQQSQIHDNELATFVIGLANATLININGAVPADMDDILQTAVTAFLRMNEVSFHPSCQFVYQNTTDTIKRVVDASNFSKKLDDFTLNAAKAENCVERYKRFNDVIKFKAQSDVHHFPGLWKGNQIMAPVHEEYSTAAQKLKRHILMKVMVKRTSSLALSSFQRKVGNIWKALLKENFVFSFRNTLEISAYNSLESQYNKWDWRFNEEMLKWEQEVDNEINTVTVEKVPELIEQKRIELRKKVSEKLYNPLKLEMDQYFKTSVHSEIIVHWKGRFEQKLLNLSERLEEHADAYCVRLGKSRDVIAKFKGEKVHYAAIMTSKVQGLIVQLKQEQTELSASVDRGRLEENQVKKVLKLFTPEKLSELKFLTADQVSKIKEAMEDCGVQSEEQALCIQKILFGGILSKEEVYMILKHSQLSLKELKLEFDKQWIKLLETIPFSEDKPLDIKTTVERKLLDCTKYSLSSLLNRRLLQKICLGETHLKLIVERKHYKRTRSSTVTMHFPIAIAKRLGAVMDGMGTTAAANSFRGVTGAYDSAPAAFTVRSGSVGGVTGAVTVTGAVGSGGVIDRVHTRAQRVTNIILMKAEQYLEDIRSKKTDFNEAFVLELLQRLEDTIEEESKAVSKYLTFLTQYKIDIYVTVCGYAVGVFEEMAESYKEKHDPRQYLERHMKGPLFSRYKDQYYQTEAEEAIANTLCALLEEPIRLQIENTLGTKMISQMKDSEQHFSSKMALKVKVLKSLYGRDDFESYRVHIYDVKESFRYWLEYYTVEYCDRKAIATGNDTQLQIAAKDEVSRLIGIVEDKVFCLQLNETGIDISSWLHIVCQDWRIRRELGVKLEADDLLADHKGTLKGNLEDGNLKQQILHALGNLKEKLHASLSGIKCANEMKKWNLKPFVALRNLIGCTEQCPFCGEQCDLTDPNHDTAIHKHRVSVHRPSCLAGYRDKETRKMSVDFCPAKVSGDLLFYNEDTTDQGHRYRDYQELYPDWSIEPDPTTDDCLYWKSFVSEYNNALANHIGEKPAEVPKEWSQIQWSDIERNLKSLYNL